MRALAALAIVVALTAATGAHAGMRLTLVMVAPDAVSQLAKDKNALADLVFRPNRDTGLEMEKEWHGLHFLLTGDPWSTKGPYGQVILGGKEIGPDLGYGPARVLTASQVKDIAAKLQAMPPETLMARYDAKKFTKAEIYPEVVWEREGLDALNWLMEGYRNLLAFLCTCGGTREGGDPCNCVALTRVVDRRIPRAPRFVQRGKTRTLGVRRKEGLK